MSYQYLRQVSLLTGVIYLFTSCAQHVEGDKQSRGPKSSSNESAGTIDKTSPVVQFSSLALAGSPVVDICGAGFVFDREYTFTTLSGSGPDTYYNAQNYCSSGGAASFPHTTGGVYDHFTCRTQWTDDADHTKGGRVQLCGKDPLACPAMYGQTSKSYVTLSSAVLVPSAPVMGETPEDYAMGRCFNQLQYNLRNGLYDNTNPIPDNLCAFAEMPMIADKVRRHSEEGFTTDSSGVREANCSGIVSYVCCTYQPTPPPTPTPSASPTVMPTPTPTPAPSASPTVMPVIF